MIYSYKGIRGADKKVSGTVAAHDEKEARQKLIGLAVRDATLKKQFSLFGAEYILLSDMGGKKLKPRDTAYFYEQMAFLLRAGMSLNECIDILTQSSNVEIAKLAFRIQPMIVSGLSIDEALDRTGMFSYDTIAKITAGRDSGQVEETFALLAKTVRKKIETRSKIVSSLTYPAFMMVLLVVVLIVMLGFIVPSIAETLLSMDVEMPMLTQIVLACSDFVVGYGLYVLAIIIVLVITHMTLMKKVDKYRYTIHNWTYKVPLVGALIMKNHLQGFSETLTQLLHSGITIANALEIAGKTVKNDRLREAIDKTWQYVTMSGYDIYSAMKTVGFFPGDYVQMVMIGSRAGDLEGLLNNISNQYAMEVEENIKRVTSLIEPLAIVGVALIGGTCVVSLYLPMFSIFEAI